jgi:hypothetical protein
MLLHGFSMYSATSAIRAAIVMPGSECRFGCSRLSAFAQRIPGSSALFAPDESQIRPTARFPSFPAVGGGEAHLLAQSGRILFSAPATPQTIMKIVMTL